MSRSGAAGLTDYLFLVRPKSSLDPLSRFIRELLRDRFCQFIRMLVRGIVEETNLLSVSATPLTKEKMDSQANSLHQGECSIKCLRLKAAGLLASGGQQGNRFGKRFHQISLSCRDTLFVYSYSFVEVIPQSLHTPVN